MTPDPTGPASSPARELDAETPSSLEDLPPDEEPTTTGTVFIMILFLMALAGMWGIMYFTLLSR
jgi:hypothetical protein